MNQQPGWRWYATPPLIIAALITASITGWWPILAATTIAITIGASISHDTDKDTPP